MRQSEILTRSLAAAGMLASGVAWVAFTSFKSSPVILADEWIYRSQVAFLEPESHQVPNYLYSFLYSITDAFGDFYRATQVLNLLFFVAFCITVYFFGRMFSGFWPALLLAFATLVSPLGFFVGFQMPEAPYFFFIGLAILLAVLAFNAAKTRLLSWVYLSEALLALLAASFIKPHSVFFVGIIGILFVVFGQRLMPNLVARTGVSFGLLGLWVSAKLGIGFLIAGTSGLVVFGETYERTLRQQLFGLSGEQVLASGEDALSNGAALDWTPLFVNMGLLIALAITLYVVLPRIGLEDQALQATRIMVIAGLVMILVVLVFQVLITRGGDNHTDRILFRHFEFLLPLLVAPLLGARASNANPSSATVAKIALVVLAALVYLLVPFGTYQPSLSDSVFLFGVYPNRMVFGILIIGLLAAIIFSRKAMVDATALVMVMFAMTFAALPLLEYRNQVSPLERTVQDYVAAFPEEDIPRVLSYRKQDAAAFLFLLNRGYGDYEVVPLGASPLDMEQIVVEGPAVVLGNLETLSSNTFLVSEKGYSRIFASTGLEGSGAAQFDPDISVTEVFPRGIQNAYGLVIQSDTVVDLERDLHPGEVLKLSLVGTNEDFGGETILFSLGGQTLSLQIPDYSLLQEFFLAFPESQRSSELLISLEGQIIEFTLAELTFDAAG